MLSTVDEKYPHAADVSSESSDQMFMNHVLKLACIVDKNDRKF